MSSDSRRPAVKTFTKADFVDEIKNLSGLPRNESADLLEGVLEVMKGVLEGGDTIKISGFGNFVVRVKSARRGRNPKTNTSMTLPKRKVLVFKPSQVLRNALVVKVG